MDFGFYDSDTCGKVRVDALDGPEIHAGSYMHQIAPILQKMGARVNVQIDDLIRGELPSLGIWGTPFYRIVGDMGKK